MSAQTSHKHDCPHMTWIRTAPTDTSNWIGKSPGSLSPTKGTIRNKKAGEGRGDLQGKAAHRLSIQRPWSSLKTDKQQYMDLAVYIGILCTTI